MKKKFLLLTLIISVFVSTISYGAVPKPSKDFFVYDEMNILSSSTKENIMNTNIELEGKTKAQVVVATVNDLEGKDPFDYSLEMFRNWGIGDKNLNNGVLILLAYQPSEKSYKVEIRVGNGLEGILNDGKVGRVIDDYFAPNFDKGDKSTYDNAVNEMFNAVISQVITEYDVKLTGDYKEYTDNLKSDSDENYTFRIIVILAMIIIASIFSSKNNRNNRNNRNRRGPFGGGGYYGGFGGYGGGGFSGGSGGGGFSGGGGSSGGGGAGRSF